MKEGHPRMPHEYPNASLPVTIRVFVSYSWMALRVRRLRTAARLERLEYEGGAIHECHTNTRMQAYR